MPASESSGLMTQAHLSLWISVLFPIHEVSIFLLKVACTFISFFFSFFNYHYYMFGTELGISKDELCLEISHSFFCRVSISKALGHRWILVISLRTSLLCKKWNNSIYVFIDITLWMFFALKKHFRKPKNKTSASPRLDWPRKKGESLGSGRMRTLTVGITVIRYLNCTISWCLFLLHYSSKQLYQVDLISPILQMHKTKEIPWLA